MNIVCRTRTALYLNPKQYGGVLLPTCRNDYIPLQILTMERYECVIPD